VYENQEYTVYEQQKYEVKVPITKYKNVTYYEPVKKVRKVPVQKTRIEYKIIKTNVCVKQPVNIY